MTPGRPAASSPASRVRAAWPSNAVRSSPLARSRTAASARSSPLPSRARASAWRIAASLTRLFSPWPILAALIPCTLRQLVAGFEPIATATTATAGSEIPVVADGHPRAAALGSAGTAAVAVRARARARPGTLAAEADEPGRPVPVPLERLEERQHLLV